MRTNVRLAMAIAKTGKRKGQIAQEAGIDPSTLSRIIHEKQDPCLDVRRRLAAACRTSMRAIGLSPRKRSAA